MATRMNAHTFLGLRCPNTVSYTLGHGPNAPIMNAKFDAFDSKLGFFNWLNLALSPKLGTTFTVRLHKSYFHGFVSRVANSMSDDSGDETIDITGVEWTDRFKDEFIFGALNIVEKGGKSWHILPDEWSLQFKRVISKELTQVDFNQLQEVNANLVGPVSKQTILSTATVMNILAKWFRFQWTCDPKVRMAMKRIKPINLDWQSGLTGSDAIEMTLSKGGFRWTSAGVNRIRITKKGISNEQDLKDFLDHKITMCGVDTGKAYTASRGNEINEDGRAVMIVGDRNQHQFTFPLVPDWNLNWSADSIYIGAMDAYLKKLGLNTRNKVKDMPKKWHDTTPIPKDTKNRTRNDLTIDEYMHKYPYRVFKVDFNTSIQNLKTNTETFGPNSGTYKTLDRSTLTYLKQPTGTIDKYPWLQQLSTMQSYSMFPMSDGLVDNTNFKYIVYHSQDTMLDHNLNITLGWNWFVPSTDGINVEQTEIIDPKTGKIGYIVRATFPDITIQRDGLANYHDLEDYLPDKMAITLSLDKGVFFYRKGNSFGAKSRRIKHQVSGLRRGYIDNQEQVLMAENFKRNLRDGGVHIGVRPVNTTDFAEKIADALLFHNAVNKVGHVEFRHVAFHRPDGIIDHCNLNWSMQRGLVENVNFIGEYDATRQQPYNLTPNIYAIHKDIPSSAKISLEEAQKNFEHFRKLIESSENKEDIEAIINEANASGSNHPKNVAKLMTGGVSNQDTIPAVINPKEQENKFDLTRGTVVILQLKENAQ